MQAAEELSRYVSTGATATAQRLVSVRGGWRSERPRLSQRENRQGANGANERHLPVACEGRISNQRWGRYVSLLLLYCNEVRRASRRATFCAGTNSPAAPPRAEPIRGPPRQPMGAVSWRAAARSGPSRTFFVFRCAPRSGHVAPSAPDAQLTGQNGTTHPPGPGGAPPGAGSS